MKSFQEVGKRQWERDSSIHDPNAIYSLLDNVNGELKQKQCRKIFTRKPTMIMETIL
jgi:hypothetical protein